MITGILGLIGTTVTLIATRPAPSDSQSMPASLVPNAATQIPTGHFADASKRESSKVPSAGSDLGLNFTKFQLRATNVHINSSEREQFVAPLIGTTVIWKGYLDGWSKHADPTADSYFTVSLVESRGKVNQSMFKTPALFRMPQSEFAAIEPLQPGDAITLTGTLQSHSMVGTILTGGHMIDAPARTATRANARGQSLPQ